MICNNYSHYTFFCIIFITLLFSLNTVNATDYHVATWGKNSNSGTITSPWETIDYAANKIAPGDTAWILNGTYVIEEPIEILTDGNPLKYKNLKRYNGTVTIDGLNSEVNGIQIIGRSYWNISGIDIKNTHTPIFWRSHDSHHVIFSDSEVSNFITPITFSNGANNITLDNVRIHTLTSGSNNHLNIFGNYQDPLKVTKNIIIRNCEIYDNNKHNGINFGPGGKSGDYWFDKYVIDNITVENTKIYNIQQAAVICNFVTVNNLSFINNTVYESMTGIRLTLKDSVLRSNEVYGIREGNPMALQFENGPSSNVTFDMNYIHDNPGSRGYYAIEIRDANGVFVSNLTQEGMSGYVSSYGGSASDREIIDIYADNYKVMLPTGSKGILFKYTNGDVFELSGSETINGPLYYPSKSEAIVTIPDNKKIFITGKHYNITVQPEDVLTDITVNLFDQSEEKYSWTVNSLKSENPTWFIIVVKSPFSKYTVNRDGSYFTSISSDSESIARFYYAESGTEWETPHTFLMKYSHDQSSGIYLSPGIFNRRVYSRFDPDCFNGCNYIDMGHIPDTEKLKDIT